MDVAEQTAVGFTVAMVCVSLVLVATRSRRKPSRAHARPQEPHPRSQAFVPPAVETPAFAAAAIETPASAPPSPGETWIILKNDQEIGPVDLDELTSYARQGLVKETELLKPSSSNAWVRAAEIAGLFPARQPAAATSASVPTLNISLSARERLPTPAVEPAAAARPARTTDADADWAIAETAETAAAANRAKTPGKAPGRVWDRIAKAGMIVGAIGALAGLALTGAPQLIALYKTYLAGALTGNSATQPANPFEVAFAGIATSDLTEERIKNELLKHPVYAKIREIDPQQFEKIAQAFLDGLKRGLSGAGLLDAARTSLDSVYAEALPYASDDDLLKVLRLTVDTTTKIRTSGSPDCYFYLHESKGSPQVADAIENNFPAEIGAEWALKRAVIENHKGKDAKVIGQQTAFLYQNKIFAQVREQFGNDANVLFGDNIPADKYLLHCSVAIAYYGEILKLPPDEAAAFFRYLLGG